MNIAEQMGRTLQRTAISTNIKERLDFSCALFGVCYYKIIYSHSPFHSFLTFPLSNNSNNENDKTLIILGGMKWWDLARWRFGS
jgi:hypothetical protein